MSESSEILVLTHPYEFFDTSERMRGALEDAVESFEGDVAGVAPSRGKRDMGEPYGGEKNYDMWFEDQEGYGRLEPDDAEKVAEYENAYLGGLGEIQCVGRTEHTIERAGADPEMVDELVDDTDIFQYLAPEQTV